MSVSQTSSIRKFGCLLCLVIFTLAFANPALAAGYIKFEGIDGETKDKDHKGWVDVLSVDWNAELKKMISSGPRQTSDIPATAVRDTAAASRRQYEPIRFHKRIDKSSPLLQTASKEGRTFKQVTLDTVDPNDPSQPIQIKLENVLISSYQTSGSDAGGIAPMESFSLNYQKISFTKLPKAKATR